MKVKTLLLAGGAAAMLAAGTATANTVVQLHTTFDTGDSTFGPDVGMVDVYRVYAELLPGQTIGAVGGSGFPVGELNSLASDGVSTGSGFWETGFFGSHTPLDDSAPGWANDQAGVTHQTYITIGQTAGWTDQSWFWGTSGTVPSSFAGTSFAWSGVVNTDQAAPFAAADANGLLLIAQITVQEGEHFSGNLHLTGAGGYSVDHSFDSSAIVPAPGALALLGLAGLVGVRRRRN